MEDTGFTLAGYEPPSRLIFGDSVFVIDLKSKAITVGDGVEVEEAAQKVIEILAQHLGCEVK
jgi:trimethylamine:corrinoid methyltransferase-like protein